MQNKHRQHPSPNNIGFLKTSIRQSLLAKRKTLPPFIQKNCAKALVQLLIQKPIWQKSQHIAFYLPQKGEVDTQALIMLALSQNKTCYLPKIPETSQNPSLHFLPYTSNTLLKKNLWGIPEPVYTPNTTRIVDVQKSPLEMICVPLVAYDSHLNRLGMGKGYYDRTLAFKKDARHTLPRLIGLAYDFQKIGCLPTSKWDIALDDVISLKTNF